MLTLTHLDGAQSSRQPFVEGKGALSEYIKIGRSIPSECVLFNMGTAMSRIPVSQTHESSKAFPQGEAKVNAKAFLAIPSVCYT